MKNLIIVLLEIPNIYIQKGFQPCTTFIVYDYFYKNSSVQKTIFLKSLHFD